MIIYIFCIVFLHTVHKNTFSHIINKNKRLINLSLTMSRKNGQTMSTRSNNHIEVISPARITDHKLRVLSPGP